MMLFGLFQSSPNDHDDDIATGTYADGAMGTSLSDLSARPREHGQAVRRTVHDRDYALARNAGQMGAGMVP